MIQEVVMYIASIPNRESSPTILLRESYREGGKVKNRTLANLTHLPKHIIEIIRRSLKGEEFVSTEHYFDKVNSWHHGHVDAVLQAMKRLDFQRLIHPQRSKERDLVVAMVIGRILEPDHEHNSKLANTRWWKITSLPSVLNLQDVCEDDLYDAMDWLLNRSQAIEKKLAKRHLHDDGLVLYDLSSSYFEGVTCPLATMGHNRDDKKGKLQINYGLLTDERGCPVAISVFPGNTLDHQTLITQAEKLRDQFGIQTMVLVGDRGMITQKLIDEKLRQMVGVDWITAIKSGAIRKLIRNDEVQLNLGDKVNLMEITTPEYSGERLVFCRNGQLAKLRSRKRRTLVNATFEKLEEARRIVEGGKLRGKDKIKLRLDKLVKNYKVAGYFSFVVEDDGFEVHVPNEGEASKAALNGARKELQNLQSSVRRAKVQGKSRIEELVDKIISKYGLNQYVSVNVEEADFDFHIVDNDTVSATALESVRQAVEKIRCLVQWGKHGGRDNIGVRIGKVVNQYKVAKHFVIDIRDDGFDFHINESKMAAEAALDGIYVIRTSLPVQRLSAEDTVRSYKSLSQVERAFRSLKTVDLKIRPIRHHLEKRVRAHIFLCMLAYYIEWHMREAWRPLLFADEDQEGKRTGNPVEPAKRSDAALNKTHSKRLDDGTEVHCFQTLLKLMSQIVLCECRVGGADPDAPTFEFSTTPGDKQKHAYDLLKTITL